MKTYLKAIFILLITLSSCQYNANTNTKNIVKLNSDSLIIHIDEFVGCEVQIEGTVKHICGVDGKKMKLKTDMGNIIRVIPGNEDEKFNRLINNNRIRVIGTVNETRLSKEYIDSLENKKSLLCHIDNTPCKDVAWTSKKEKEGVLDSLSKVNITKARKQMGTKNYISVVTVTSRKIEILD